MSCVLPFLASYSLTKTSCAAAAQPGPQRDGQGPGPSVPSLCVLAKALRPGKEHMVDPGSQPSSAVYPLQDKLSTSTVLSAAVLLLIKRSFDGKTGVCFF